MAKKPATIKIASKEETAQNRLSPEQVRQFRLSREQQREQRRLRQVDKRLEDAATAPLPGPLRQAFAAPPQTILGQRLIPVCAGHIAVLTQVENPFLRAMRLATLHARARTRADKKRIEKIASAIKTTVASTAEALFIFTRTYHELADLLEQGSGPWQQAVRGFMAQLPPLTEWEGIERALGSWFMLSYITAINFRAKDRPGGAINFPNPARKTALAGGSTRYAS